MKKSDGVSFQEWSKKLDAYAVSVGFFENMVQETGEDCWRESFEDDMMPEEAFIEGWSE